MSLDIQANAAYPDGNHVSKSDVRNLWSVVGRAYDNESELDPSAIASVSSDGDVALVAGRPWVRVSATVWETYFWYKTVADLKAATYAGYDDGEIVSVGSYIYEVQPSSATDHHLTNSGGQKFKLTQTVDIPLDAVDGDFTLAEGIGPVDIGASMTVSAPTFLTADSRVKGSGRRWSTMTLDDASARLDVGGGDSSVFAANVQIRDFTIDGQDVADWGLVLTDLMRDSPTTLGASVYTGQVKISDIEVKQCNTVGIHLGADSDNAKLDNVLSLDHQGASSDAIRIETPCFIENSTFASSTRSAVMADTRLAGDMLGTDPTTLTPHVQAVLSNCRLNFCRNLVHLYSDAIEGPSGGNLVLDTCFFENAGLTVAGGTPVTATPSTLEPSMVHCEKGLVSVLDPKGVVAGWALSMFKANGGDINLRFSGVELQGSNASRPCVGLVSGLSKPNTSCITVQDTINLKDTNGFSEVLRAYPRENRFPIAFPNANVLWESSLDDTTEWTNNAGVTGLAVTTAADDVFAGGSAYKFAGNGSATSSYLRRQIDLNDPRTEGRCVAMQMVTKAIQAGGTNAARMAPQLDYNGGVALTAGNLNSTIYNWTNTDGYDVWTYHTVAGYVDDWTKPLRVTIFGARAAASTDEVVVGKVRLLLI